MSLNTIDQHTRSAGVAVRIAGDDHGEGLVKAGTTITPGTAVVRDASGIVAQAGNGAANVAGWAEDNSSAPDPAVGTEKDNYTAFAAGSRCGYYRNKGDLFMGVLADQSSATAVAKEARLKTATTGFTPANTDGSEEHLVVAKVRAEDGIVANGAVARGLMEWVA